MSEFEKACAERKAFIDALAAKYVRNGRDPWDAQILAAREWRRKQRDRVRKVAAGEFDD